MNIFVLSTSPRLAAKYHCDKHLSKMLLESVQMLSTTNALLGYEHPYRVTHVNHPCSIWVRQSLDNYNWLRELVLWLEEERQHRYGSRPCHDSAHKMIAMPIAKRLPKIGLTRFALAMPEQYRQKSVVASYREFYKHKPFELVWSNRPKPPWF